MTEQKNGLTQRSAQRMLARLSVVAVVAALALAAPGLPALLDTIGGRAAPEPAGPAAARPPQGDGDRDPDGDEDGDEPGPAERRERTAAAVAEEPEAPAVGGPPRLAAPITFDRGASLRPGRVVIPAIGLDTTYGIGVHDEVLEEGPGHWPGTALPGQAGNGVLSGHRTTFTHPFRALDRLVAGDVIAASVGPQPPAEYRVTGVHVVPEAEYVAFVLRQPQDPTARELTLFACHPKGRRTHRIVVTAQADPLPAPPGAG